MYAMSGAKAVVPRRRWKSLRDHSGQAFGPLLVLGPVGELSGARDARYRVRWSCCGREVEMLRETVMKYAQQQPPLHCNACRQAIARGPFNEPGAVDDPALAEDPPGVLQSALWAEAQAQAHRVRERERAELAARIKARRVETQTRLARIAAGLLPTPPSGRVQGPGDLLRRFRERGRLAQVGSHE